MAEPTNANRLLRILFESSLVVAILVALALYCTRELVMAQADSDSAWQTIRQAVGTIGSDADPVEQPAEMNIVRVPLDDLQLVGLTGTTSRFDLQDLRGKVVLINFWGTWCAPCRKEFPAIEALARHYRRDRDVRILAVSCSGGLRENLPKLKQQTSEFLSQQGTTLPTLADPEGRSRQAIERAVGFRGYPTTILLNRQGEIRGVWVGAPHDAERLFAEAIECVRTSDDVPLASGRPPERTATREPAPAKQATAKPVASGPKTVSNPFAAE